MDNPEIVTKLPDNVLREFYDEVAATIPQEKVQQGIELAKTAKVLRDEGSTRMDGLGQKVASVPARIYHRWNQMLPGCWNDRSFVMAFLQDNPECAAPGFWPKYNTLRHGKTFVGGKPV